MPKEARKSRKARAKPVKKQHRVLQQGQDAVAREAAISDILRVISSSAGDLQPVFDTILAHTIRLCQGAVAMLWQFDGEKLRFAAHKNSTTEAVAYSREHPLELGTYNPTPQAGLERRIVQVLDVFANPNYRPLIPVGTSGKRPNAGTVLAVPLVRENELFGVITIWRYEKRPFSERQIELVKTFTAQAVIAIQNVRLFNETKESLERQTATADILRVISGSPTSVQPVFEAILDNATRLCEAQLGALFLADGEIWNMVSHRGASLEAPGFYRNFRVGPNTGLGRMIKERQPVHIEDLVADAATSERDPLRMATIEKLGARTFLAVPLLKDASVLGAVVIYRKEVRPFGDAQIRLLSTFADQAVIAIENVRLFNETRESLERQTATSEILRVIAGSPNDVQPVFDTIVRNAVALCQGMFANAFRYDGEVLHFAASSITNPKAREFVAASYPMPPGKTQISGRAVIAKNVVRMEDALSDPDYDRRHAEIGGWRRMLGVPMLRDGNPIGAIVVAWAEPGSISKVQEELLRTFADQAVIAIENVRLFNETKESLEQQTAISEILRVISSSPSDVKPVFDAVAERAARICNARVVDIVVPEGDKMRIRATVGDLGRPLGEAVPLDRTTVMGRSIVDQTTVQVEDLQNAGDEFPLGQQLAHKYGHRTILAVPLVRAGKALGTILLRRAEVRPFEDKHIGLLRTFADQAAIAIENVRLFNETKEALDQQTAISEVLRVISSSPGDVIPVLEAVAERAARICDAFDARIFLEEGDKMRHVAGFGQLPIGVKLGETIALSRGWVAGRAVLERKAIHIEDLLAVPADEFPVSRGLQERVGHRTLLVVPLMREQRALGAITLRRMEVRSFTEKQIALLKTFADQAAIAIQNVRLFNETREALEHQQASGEILRVISNSVSDTRPVFDAIVASCARLFPGYQIGINLITDTGELSVAASIGIDQAALERVFQQLSKTYPGGGVTLRGKVAQFADTEAPDVPVLVREGCRAGGTRAIVFAAMVSERRGIGALWIARASPGPFSAKEVALLQTFADQAVIAIQNARLFHEIQEKSAQLEVANKHKSDFLANMSHELRTPLNAIIGFSEALMERMFGEVNEKQADYLKDIHESGRHLLSLINDILDLSKIEAGRMDLELSSFHLPTALSNAMTLVRERAQRHSINLHLDVDQRLGEFQADERKFKQIMLNLLSNAVKFTPDGGRVDVCATRDTDKIEIAVKDTGIGIAAEDQAVVFEEFKQVGRDQMRKAEGTGLGLALTKRFVELHGGAIRLESTPGKGSTFTVSLPLRTT